MPSLSSATQAQLLAALFQGAALPVASQVFVALHNANPGGLGTQSTNETAYSNYARVAVPCSPGSTLVTPGEPAQSQNIQSIAFPSCGVVGDTLSFWSLGYASSGPGQIIMSGPIGPGTAFGFSGDVVSDLLFVPLLPPGMLAGQAILLQQFGPGMLLPGGFSDGGIYYAVAVEPELISLSATPSGAPIQPSTGGTGILLPVNPLTVMLNIAPTFPPNSLFTFMG